MAKISMIIPVYNVADYLEDCLRSLAAQTIQDVEFLLINDGSTDGSGEICDRWAQMDYRFFAVHQPNGGVSAARNHGLKLVTGAYIGFADSDDWLEPNALELLSSLLDSNPQAEVACAGYYEYPSDPQKPPIVHPTSDRAAHGFADRETALQNVLMRGGYFVSVCNKLFRRSFVYRNREPRLFRTALHMGEDEIWLLTLLADSGGSVFSSTPIYHWRSRASSMTHQTVLTQKRMSVLEAKQIAVSLMSDVSPELKKLAESRLYNDTFDLRIFAYRADDRQAMKRIRQAVMGSGFSWLISGDVRPVRKGKVAVLLVMMWLQMPKEWVWKVNNFGSRQKVAA